MTTSPRLLPQAVLGILLVALSAATGCAGSAAKPPAPLPPTPSFHVGFAVIDITAGATPLTVAVWYPTTAKPSPYTYGGPTKGLLAVDGPMAEGAKCPLLVFSHGYGGSGLSAVFLFEALAARGWVVVAPDHRDDHSAVRIRSGVNPDLDRRAFYRSAQAIGQSGPEDRGRYLYRIDELQQTLNQLLASRRFGPHIDPDRIAVGGHSFGGFTALGLCGPLPAKQDRRIKALLLFSTGAGGYLYRPQELARVQIPTMYLYGEREKEQKRGAHTMAELVEKISRNLAGDTYLLEVKDAGHFSFNNRFSRGLAARLLSGNEQQFDLIRRYALAFLEHYVAGRPGNSAQLAQGDPLLVRYAVHAKGE